MTTNGSQESGFIGRQPELAKLTAALDDALAGRGRLVMLAGEPGIGKTRLAQELARQAQEHDVRVLWGWSYEGDGAPPYWPWVDSLRTYIQTAESDLLSKQLGSGAASIGEMIPEVLAVLDDVGPAPSMEPDQARFRLFDAITRFLKRASEDSPILLVLDDLHWADQPSLLLLEFLAQQLEGSRILIAGTYRDTEAPPESPLGESLARLARMASFQRQAITGLPSEDVGSFVRLETGITPPEQLLSAIHAHTEGNPFFLGEVVRYLAELGRLDEASASSSDSENLGIPQGVRDVIGQRLMRLTEGCNLALTTASVIGREFEFNLLASLTDSGSPEELLDLMDEAISARIIEDLPGGEVGYQFRHALMQQTLVENISAARKVRLHANIGEALEKAYGENPGNHAGQLAHHFTQAVSVLGTEKMLRYTLMAGERALESYAWEEATEYFSRGLEAKGVDSDGKEPAADADAADLLFGLARAKSAYFRFGTNLLQTVANLRSAFEYYLAAGDTERAVEIAQSPPRVPVGERSGLKDVMEIALGIAPPGSSAKGQLLAHFGWAAGVEDADYPVAVRAFEEALEIARDNDDRLLLQQTIALAAQLDFYHRLNNEAREKALQVIAMAEAGLDLTVECTARYVYCMSSTYVGEPADQQELDAFIKLAERLGNRLWLHLAYWVSSTVARVNGDWEKARQLGERALDAAPNAPTILSSIPHIEFETGNFDRAEELFQKLYGLLSDIPLRPTFYFPATVLVAGMSSWFTGSPREPALPKRYSDIMASSPHTIPVFVSVNDIGLAFEALARDDKEGCQRAYDELASWSRGDFINVIVIDRLLGHLAHVLGNIPQAIDHFKDSLDFCTKAGYKPEHAWTCWGYAAALLERGSTRDPGLARELLEDALKISTELGMPPLRQRVEDLMSRAGNAPAPAYPGGLTKREVEVLLLISGGNTDREIGEELFISVKTVGNHVSNILNKTGAANRAEAATYAALHGIVTDDSAG